MKAAEARARFGAARVARLGTVSGAGEPHLVPITFALLGEAMIVTAVDHKPKRTTALKRLANIAVNPAVSVLVDEYAEDWSRLWWARADGRARVVPEGVDRSLRAGAVRALQARYDPYRERPPRGVIVAIEVERWSGWSSSPPSGRGAQEP